MQIGWFTDVPPPAFNGVRVAQSLVLCVVRHGLLLIILSSFLSIVPVLLVLLFTASVYPLGIFKLIDMSILPKPIVICHTFRLRYQAETVLLWKRLDSQLFSSKSMIEKLMTVNCFCRFTHFRH
jgi:hypothetical protein